MKPAKYTIFGALSLLILLVIIFHYHNNHLSTNTLVSIKTGNKFGSGVLIGQRSDGLSRDYFVLTANHVVNGFGEKQSSIKHESNIMTYDEKNYHGIVIENIEKLDLLILKFQSTDKYNTMKLSKTIPIEKEKVFLAGFVPCNSSRVRYFHSNSGEVGNYQAKLQEALKDGLNYIKMNDIFYTNSSGQGMSGGAVTDKTGYLIAINSAKGRASNTINFGCEHPPESNFGSFGTSIHKFLSESISKEVLESLSIH